MIRLDIEVESATRVTRRRAVVDSGFTGDLIMPLAAARALGVELEDPGGGPATLTGKRLAGLAGGVIVRVPAAGVEAVALVFCPRARGITETLLGARFLGRVGARLVIGSAAFPFPRPNPAAPARPDVREVLDWVVPLERPARWPGAPAPRPPRVSATRDGYAGLFRR